jgi:hypothetical protein
VHWYRLTPPADWSGTRKIADTHGTWIVNVGSPEENEFVRSYFASYKDAGGQPVYGAVWIGLNDPGVWSYGPDSGYRNWYPGEPNGDDETQVEMYLEGRWNDIIPNPSGNLPGIVETARLPGDFNQDGAVDLGDFAIFRGNFGKTGQTLDTGDMNLDTFVGLDDFGEFRTFFGKRATDPCPPLTAVPEPSSLVLAAAALVAAGRRMLRRRR